MVTGYDKMHLLAAGATEASSFTAKAAGDISGGDLVIWNSGVDCVAGSANQNPDWDWDDVAVTAASAVSNVVLGIADHTVTSGAELTIWRKGTFVLPAGSGTVTGGARVQYNGYSNSVIDLASGTAVEVASRNIGRALTSSTAETTYVLVALEC